MEVGIALVAGIAIGWVIEWVIDWQYWRRGVAGFYATESQLRSELDNARVSVQATSEELQRTQVELHAAQAQLQAARVRESELQRRLHTLADAHGVEVPSRSAQLAQNASGPVSLQPDDLKRIEGIGAVYEKRLNECGVLTFEQLAELSPDTIEDMIQPAAWQNVDFDSWIEQAGQLAVAQDDSENH